MSSRQNEQPFRLQQKKSSIVDPSPIGPTPTSLGPTPLGPGSAASFKQISASNRRWADYTPSGVTPSTITLGQEHPTASVVFPNTPTPLEYTTSQGLSFSEIMGSGSSSNPSPMPMSVQRDSGRNSGYAADPPPHNLDRMEPAMINPPSSVGQQLLHSAFTAANQPSYLGTQIDDHEPGARLKVKNTFIDDYDSDEDSFAGTATHELGAKSLPVGLVRSGGPPGQFGNPLQYSRVSAQTSSAATAAVLNGPPGQMGPPLLPQGQMWRQPPVGSILSQPAPGMGGLGSQLSAAAHPPTQQTVIQPYNIRQPQPSCGSDKHGTGECRPCAWFWKPQGCANGIDCRHCHMCPEGELKNRKKDKVYQMRTK